LHHELYEIASPSKPNLMSYTIIAFQAFPGLPDSKSILQGPSIRNIAARVHIALSVISRHHNRLNNPTDTHPHYKSLLLHQNHVILHDFTTIITPKQTHPFSYLLLTSYSYVEHILYRVFGCQDHYDCQFRAVRDMRDKIFMIYEIKGVGWRCIIWI
jgi:hypothetical protein